MKKLLLIFSLIFLSFIILTCSDDQVSNPVGNKAPDTGLFLYPDSTINQQPSKLHVHWWGDDPDGVVEGFYIMWEGIDSAWGFTKSNDSIFALPIGTSDTTYKFFVVSVDAEGGNEVYDNSVIRNGISFGAEPFTDSNGNGKYDEGENYVDIGLVDPTPAELIFPIKNTAPVLQWNELTVLPDTSFPVMTFKWDADDLDGDETIQAINISLNDTINYITLNGSVRLVTLRIKDLNASIPEMEILINGSDQNIFPETLSGLQLNSDNKFYVQAVDLSGAVSNIISLPDTGTNWYVKKPKGQLLIFDDFAGSSSEQAKTFYRNEFNSIGLQNKYDEYDLNKQPLPFESVTVYEMMKLFKYTYWYSVSNPRLDLLNAVTNKYLNQGGKIAFSMTFQSSSSTYEFDLSTLQGFLPIDSVSSPLSFLLSGADVLPAPQSSGYSTLRTTSTISYVRTYIPNSVVTDRVYLLSVSQISGNVGFITKDKTEFFIGLPLYDCNGGNQNVDELLSKIFFDEFGLVP